MAEAELQGRVPRLRELAAQLGFDGPVTPLAAGSFHVVHGLRRGEEKFVVRSTLPGVFTEDRALRFEGLVRSWMAPVGHAALVPRTERVQFQGDGVPFDFAILGFAEGAVLRDLGDAVLDAQPNYLRTLGAALHAIHDVEGHGAGLLDCKGKAEQPPTGVHDDWRAYQALLFEPHLRTCRDAGFVDAAMSDRIVRLFETMQPALRNRPLRLLHGDLGPHNICVDPVTQKVTAVLDWEDALIGDPLFDVAMVSSFQPARRLPAILEGYGPPRPTHEQQALIAFYFLRIALAKTVHRLRFGIVDRPDRTPGHHRITRGVDELSRLI
ncbi:aminoglycoside phosphotransferase family protein [Bradyrhizobium jicamae]|uniref:phosphotransferase family protein n=1 Tax=Bradyrhizobium jicamae TaxID=280332 RepID=UPI001BAB7205|nr:aminoglycoside phosphotransferase family protein [Bradyrhizobium jicamae]MBR0750595.1 aminoglycoside phosphotransferase family protein [Bradyrhizobium jicamae]